jgi:hypothetical protein
MDHFVRIERLPEGIQFPEEFRDRLLYDEARHRLVYRGFMSKGDFDRLCRLSDDWSFRRPLEELFRQCTPETAMPSRGLRGWFSSIMGL